MNSDGSVSTEEYDNNGQLIPLGNYAFNTEEYTQIQRNITYLTVRSGVYK